MKIFFFLFLALLPYKAYAQDIKSDLQRIANSIEQLQSQITSKQKALTSNEGAGREAELQKQIVELSNNQKSLELSLEEIASGVNIEPFIASQVIQKISWQAELEELLSPILSQIKRSTSRPREIEKLRTELSDTEQLILLSEQALQNLDNIKVQENTNIDSQLKELKTKWEQRKKSLLAKLSILKQKLEQRVSEKKNLSESLQEIFHLFFKSRGKNLLFALISAFGFWILSKRINLLIQKPGFSYLSNRIFNMLFLLGSGVGSVFVFLMVLFFTGDWLLLILSFFIITGIIWNSKEAISKFWGESLLLLNLGPVRENEIVIYKGVRFKVKSLNYNAVLENPLFNQNIKLPLRDLLDLRSIKENDKENWFPTKTGDWILISGSKLSCVESQSLENVLLRFPGGGFSLVNSSEFITLDKINISSGFRINVTIGLDYTVQGKIISEILGILYQDIKLALNQSNYGDYLVSLRVEFEKPGSSSLDIAIIADFKGDIAKDYDTIRRLVNQIALTTCTKNNWPLPFPQMDIHLKNGSASLI